MTNRYDLYGWHGPDRTLFEAAHELRETLGIEFALHESHFLGGDYWLWKGVDGAKIAVRPNAEDEDGELSESNYPDEPVLVFASALDASAFARLAQVPELLLLRSREV